jgi:hypothetical protein
MADYAETNNNVRGHPTGQSAEDELPNTYGTWKRHLKGTCPNFVGRRVRFSMNLCFRVLRYCNHDSFHGLFFQQILRYSFANFAICSAGFCVFLSGSCASVCLFFSLFLKCNKVEHPPIIN